MQSKDEQLDPFASIDGMLNGKLADSPASVSVAKGLVRLEKAPNAIQFIEQEKFLGAGTLFPYQFNVVAGFLELRCPFCNSLDEISLDFNYPRDNQVIYENNVCPRCGYYKYDQPESLRNYNELVGVAGMRGGKSALAAFMAHWKTHEILTFPNLQTKLGLLEGQLIEGAFCAVSAVQSEETVFSHYMNFFKNSQWYNEYIDKLKKLEKDKSREFKSGELVQDRSAAKLYFGDRRLLIKSLHSNSATLAGKTRIFAVIDELSRFDSSESKQSADSVYQVLKRSLTNVAAAVYDAREKEIYDIPSEQLISISSPMFSRDRTMRLLEEAKEDRRVFSFKATTVEMNPNIKKEHLASEFARDPVGAKRDYDASPPDAQNPLIDDPRIVDVCVTDIPSIFTYKESFFDVEVKEILFNYLKLDILGVNFNHLTSYAIHCDPGQAKDSFSLVIGHLEKDGMLIFDGVLEARPFSGGGGQVPRHVHFPSMTNIILELNKKLSIAIVSYDKWNSIEALDLLRASGILAIGKNLDRDDHVKLVEKIRSEKVKFPKKEHPTLDPFINRNMPVSKAIEELKALEDDGRKVDHATNLSNDLAQGLVGVSRALLEPEKLIDQKKLMASRRKDLGRNPFQKGMGQVVHLKRFV